MQPKAGRVVVGGWQDSEADLPRHSKPTVATIGTDGTLGRTTKRQRGDTMTATLQQKTAKKAAKSLAAEQARLISRIRNLFELEHWPTERIADAIGISRSEVIQMIQTEKKRGITNEQV